MGQAGPMSETLGLVMALVGKGEVMGGTAVVRGLSPPGYHPPSLRDGLG